MQNHPVNGRPTFQVLVLKCTSELMQCIVHWQTSFLVSLNSEFENCRGRKGIQKNYLEKVEKKINWMKIENREEKAKSYIKL